MTFQKKLIDTIYQPPMKDHEQGIDEIYADSSTRVYYSLARHALKEGLFSLGITKKKVLIPAFICRDVLAPFNELECEVLFYDVDRKLDPILPLEQLPEADAILMVHFFGLEANIAYFESYCQKWNAKLIEDNAHGFLSKSVNGQLLGTHGDIGIISIRKTLPIENGAILLSKKQLAVRVPEVIEFLSFRMKIKKIFRPIVKLLGVKILDYLTSLKRKIRKMILGQQFPVSTFQDELKIPGKSNPCNIESYLKKMDYFGEIKRRRQLFNLAYEILKGSDVNFLRGLGPHEVPYVFPFYCKDENLPVVSELLKRNGLEVIKWPALPLSTQERISQESFYHQLYMVKFLW